MYALPASNINDQHFVFMVLSINRSYFVGHHKQVHIYNREVLCFLWGTDWHVYYLDQGYSTGVQRDVARGSARDRDWKKQTSFLNLLAKINRSTEKNHSLLKRALTIIIGLLYLQLTDHANIPWAIDIIIFMQGFPETWKLFQGFL
jgi:hypothetical protein